MYQSSENLTQSSVVQSVKERPSFDISNSLQLSLPREKLIIWSESWWFSVCISGRSLGDEISSTFAEDDIDDDYNYDDDSGDGNDDDNNDDEDSGDDHDDDDDDDDDDDFGQIESNSWELM